MLKGKTVLLTGANGALGQAVATTAADMGANLILVDITEESQFQGEASHQYLKLDLTDGNAVKKALGEHHDIDVVLNVAGGFDMGTPVHETDEEQWNTLFKLNVSTMHNVCKAVIPAMINRGRGAIVNVGALGATSGAALMGTYCASKSTVMRLTESMSGELKQQGINVNAVLPSIIDSPANRAAMPDADPSQWVSPQDLANVMCFLGSEQAKAIHGALVPVAGLS